MDKFTFEFKPHELTEMHDFLIYQQGICRIKIIVPSAMAIKINLWKFKKMYLKSTFYYLRQEIT